MPVILATQEAEISIPSQPRQIVLEALSRKYLTQKGLVRWLKVWVLSSSPSTIRKFLAECQWLTPVILASQKAEIRRIEVQSQLGQIVHETLSRKNPSQKRAYRAAQGVDFEFKSQYCEKKKKRKRKSMNGSCYNMDES
jgi:hypothetical protein